MNVIATSHAVAAPSPAPVVVVDADRDAIDWAVIVVGVLSVVIGIVAVYLAVRANTHAREEGNASRRLIAAERRRAFELEVLRDLIEAVGADDRNAAYALMTMVGDDELPLLRDWAVHGLRPQLDGVYAEIREAIARRLHAPAE